MWGSPVCQLKYCVVRRVVLSVEVLCSKTGVVMSTARANEAFSNEKDENHLDRWSIKLINST